MPSWALPVGGAVVGAIVAVALYAALSGGGGSASASDSGVKAAMVAAGCTYQDVLPKPPKDKTNYHADVPSLTSSTKGLWSTFPPSAGGHYGSWAIWGFYNEAVNPRNVVHNLEHGAVVIWWGPKVPVATVQKLSLFYQEQPVGVFGTPIAGLGNKIALTAWTGDNKDGHVYYKNGYYGMGHIATCTNFDEHAFRVFRDAYRGKGPEGVPLSADAPGTGP